MKYRAREYLSSSKDGMPVAKPGEFVELTAEQAKILLAAGAVENVIGKPNKEMI